MKRSELLGRLALVILIRTIIIVVFACIIGYFLDMKMLTTYNVIMEYEGVLLLVIGLFSIFEDMGVSGNVTAFSSNVRVRRYIVFRDEYKKVYKGLIFSLSTILSGGILIWIGTLLHPYFQK